MLPNHCHCMKRDVQARIRKRIRDRLDEQRMTARELARHVGHDDAWISGVLAGSQGLHWKDFDKVAEKLNLNPAELVRYDEDELRELNPSEMRMLRHFQAWPQSIRDRWLDMLDYFALMSQDRVSAHVLHQLQRAPDRLKHRVDRFLQLALREELRPDILRALDDHARDEEVDGKGTRRPAPQASEKSLGTRHGNDGQKRNR